MTSEQAKMEVEQQEAQREQQTQQEQSAQQRHTSKKSSTSSDSDDDHGRGPSLRQVSRAVKALREDLEDSLDDAKAMKRQLLWSLSQEAKRERRDMAGQILLQGYHMKRGVTPSQHTNDEMNGAARSSRV